MTVPVEYTPCPDIRCTFSSLPYDNHVVAPKSAEGIAIYSSSSDYFVMPVENTLHGGVTDTLDALLSPLTVFVDAETVRHRPVGPLKLKESISGRNNRQRARATARNGFTGSLRGEFPKVVGDLRLGIRHVLVVRKGVRMEDIRWVRSHEQVRSPHLSAGSVWDRSMSTPPDQCYVSLCAR